MAPMLRFIWSRRCVKDEVSPPVDQERPAAGVKSQVVYVCWPVGPCSI